MKFIESYFPTDFNCELINLSINKIDNASTILSRIELTITRSSNIKLTVELYKSDGLLVNINTPVWFGSNSSSSSSDISFCSDKKV